MNSVASVLTTRAVSSPSGLSKWIFTSRELRTGTTSRPPSSADTRPRSRSSGLGASFGSAPASAPPIAARMLANTPG
jgi:hypothetical protein